MQTNVALLRGINVGGNNKVDMKKLKIVFETMGAKNVSTYINSGNVIYATAKEISTTTIETALHKAFGFPIRVVTRTQLDIKKICAELPSSWTNDTEQRTDILFLWDEFDTKAVLQEIVSAKGVDTLKYVNGAVLWNVDRTHFKKSGMHKFIGTKVYKHMTARNVNTVRKLFELMST